MGSPALSVPTLNSLVRTAGHEVPVVVTQPSRRAGRGLRERMPPVGIAAEALGLDLYQPRSLRGENAAERIAAARPDVIVVVAFGRILPPPILTIPRLGCLNVHLSLLPRHRGASPISGAILAGDETTGVSIMLMEEGLDSGPVLAQARTPIAPEDDEITLAERLSTLAADLLVDTLPKWEARSVEALPQDEAAATWTRPTARADGKLDWTEPALSLWRRVRSYAAWPQAFTHWDGKLLRILKADYVDSSPPGPPGLVRALEGGRRPRAIAISAGRGELLPLVLGLEGRKALPIETFLQGASGFVGAQLETKNGFSSLS
ncbi:MAG: methionyl-tRNA formyltransferase [Chloroflexi bacterium]|nr:methionyl-tRNA formyltransferase [Chloroflexota bacterium]